LAPLVRAHAAVIRARRSARIVLRHRPICSALRWRRLAPALTLTLTLDEQAKSPVERIRRRRTRGCRRD